MSGQGNQHHLGQLHSGQHVMYQNVQQAQQQQQQVTHHQQTQAHVNHGTHHGGGGSGNAPVQTSKSSKKNKKPKVNKDGVPAPKRATTAYINFTQWYREELKKAGRSIPKVSVTKKEEENQEEGVVIE